MGWMDLRIYPWSPDEGKEKNDNYLACEGEHGQSRVFIFFRFKITTIMYLIYFTVNDWREFYKGSCSRAQFCMNFPKHT